MRSATRRPGDSRSEIDVPCEVSPAYRLSVTASAGDAATTRPASRNQRAKPTFMPSPTSCFERNPRLAGALLAVRPEELHVARLDEAGAVPVADPRRSSLDPALALIQAP